MAEENLYFDRNLQIIFLVTLMAVLGVSSITPVFPKVIQKLSIPPESVGLLITSFTAPGIILTFFFGILSDRFGRKKILVPSLFLFGIAGFTCSLATDFSTLLILRFVQGIGAASLGSLNATIIGDLYAGKERDAAMGYNASVLSIGTASYPAIGGALAAIEWNVPFMLPIFAIPVGVIVLFALDNPEPENQRCVRDYFRKAGAEMQNRLVIAIFIASTMTFVLLYGVYLTYFPIFLEFSFDADTVLIGLVMSIMSVVTSITSAQLSRLSRKISGVRLILISFVLYGLSFLLMLPVTELWMIIIPITVLGVAQGINIPNLQSLLAGQASLESRGAIMSLNGMVLRIGQSIGPVLMGMAFVSGGLSLVFLMGTFAAFATLFLLLIIILYKA